VVGGLACAGAGEAGQLEIALLGEIFRPDANVVGPSTGTGSAWGAQVDWPVAASWCIVADARAARQASTLPFGDASTLELTGGFRFFPFGMSRRSPLFAQAELGWLRLDLEGRPRPVDRPVGVFALGQRIRLNERWALLWEARAHMTPSDADDPIQQRITEPGARLGISYRLGRPDDDADRDGIPDPVDACPGTPAGARVDASGCPLDDDHDGVPNGLDQCPRTPRGMPVDGSGCSPLRDSDADGVPDGVDSCADTPQGQRVDSRGCPTDEPMARAIPPLQLQDVVFRTKSVQLSAESLEVLRDISTSLKIWPEVTVTIAGERDPGAAPDDRDLGIRRAESVQAYLVAQGVPAKQLRVAPTTAAAKGPAPRVRFLPEVP
jgi:OOP family OmpA-OmpF porin